MKIEEMKNEKSRPIRLGERPARRPPQETAQILSRQALIFLAKDLARAERFLSLTGIQPSDIRKLTAEKGFQLAVLDHLLADEFLLMQFAESEGIDPHDVGASRRALEASDE
jgi:hypothetical protein